MHKRAEWHLVGFGLASAVCVGLVLVDSAVNQAFTHAYLIWNLFLAWIPLVFAYELQRILRRKLWSSWGALTFTILWLAFLPNSFYIVSDFIHLHDFDGNQLLFGVVVLSSLMLTGLWLGFTSLYLVHRELCKRFSARTSGMLVALTLLVSSMAVYIGRDLRWNSWDLLFNPFGLLFDLSERLLHPSQYGQVLDVVGPMFILLATVYFLIWRTAQVFARRPAETASHP